jgi:hypothetical protein
MLLWQSHSLLAYPPKKYPVNVRARGSVWIVLLFASRAASLVYRCRQLGKPSALRVVCISLPVAVYVAESLSSAGKGRFSRVPQSSSGDVIGGCSAVALRCTVRWGN